MGKQHSPRFLKIVDEAAQRVGHCSVQDVQQKLDQHEPFHLVDVREESEWARGHLPRAIHLGKGVLERDIEQRIPQVDATIVLYCGGGYRSALAADSLQRMGYQNVLSMDGGFSAWKNAGLPLETPAD